MLAFRTPTTRLTKATFGGLVGVALAASAVLHAQAPAPAATRTVFVSVLDKNGAPVKGLLTADFQVKENGKTAEIVRVKPATMPMRIAILDSDGGTGAYQLGALRFMQKLDGYAEFSLTSIIAPFKLVDFSTDGPSLSKALDQIGRRANEPGGHLMWAINEATRTIRADGKRGVIVVLRIGGEDVDAELGPDMVRDRIRRTNALLDVISVRGANRRPTTSAKAMMPDLASVLIDGSRESGGHFEEAPPLQMAKALEALGDDLVNQYDITYTAVPGAKSGDKLQVSTGRKGVDLFAPNHVAY